MIQKWRDGISILRRKALQILAGLALTGLFALHSAHIVQMPGLSSLELYLYDVRMRQSAAQTVDDRIVILDIDEKSLAEFGRWPWNRTRIAQIIDTSFDHYGIAALGFDVVWAESETDQIATILEETGAARTDPTLRRQLDTDAILAETMQNRPVVLGYYFNNESGSVTKNILPRPVLSAADLPATASLAAHWTGYTGNIAPLMTGSVTAGHINSIPDADGVIRRVPLLIAYQEAYYESLSLAMLRALFGGEPIKPVIAQTQGYQRVEALQMGPLQLPVDQELAALVNFRGPAHSFTYISLGDILAKRVPVEKLAGRIALIGTSAPGLRDQRATPTDPIMPGVEVHANMIASALDQNIRAQPAYVVGLDVAQVLTLGLLAALLLPLLGAISGTLVFAALGAVAIWFNFQLWNHALFVVPLASILATLVAVYIFNLGWGFLIEGRAKRQLGDMFGQYVPPKLVQEMAKDPANYSMEGRDAELTVVFSDLRGFTSISEQLSARDLAAYINAYLTDMSAIIAGLNGTLDKFIGDAIMAFWGAPVEDPLAAEHAVCAAIEMQKEAERLSQKFLTKGWPAFQIGVGVNSGPMRVGDMGSRLRRAYTVMGDAVNLGSRLEGLTKNYGVGIIIGENTAKLLPHFSCRMLDRVRVKGKQEAVAIYEPLGKTETVSAQALAELANWNKMMDCYFAMDWAQTQQLLTQARALGAAPSLCDLFEARLRGHIAHPPAPGWDGVTKFTAK